MYAVVSTGGKQLKVETGSEAVVEKLDAAVGETVTFDVLFVADDDSIVTGAEALSTVTVTAEVLEHFKGDKQVIFKFKKRKGYKRLKGHRQDQTRVLITEIATGGTAKKAAKKAEPKAEKPEPKTPKASKAPKAEPKAEKPAPAKVEEPAVEVAADCCAALKADGTQCQNKPKEGSKYCGVHAKKYEG